MTAALQTTAVGVFTDHDKANAAIAALHRAGFGTDRVGVASRQSEPTDEDTSGTSPSRLAGSGVVGALTGGTVGGVLGAAAAGLIPGIGPVVGTGILAMVAGGAAAGAVAGGALGTLVGLGVPEDEARYYQDELDAGRIIVSVKADGRYSEAVEILRRHGAHGKGSPLI